MNIPYFEGRENTADLNTRSDEAKNIPAENSATYVDQNSVNTPQYYGTPKDLPIAAMDPITESRPGELPVEKNIAVVDSMEELSAYEVPMDKPIPQETPFSQNTGSLAALLSHEDSELFRKHWNEIQAMFVDEPRSAVQKADALVIEVVDKITQMFTTEHNSLESQWNQGNEVSTEELRKALQRYRSFFNRLVV